MNFAQALEELKAGKLIQRKGWGNWTSKNIFVFILPGESTTVSELRQLSFPPEALKEFYKDIPNGNVIEFSQCFALKKTDNNIVVGWHPSITDMLADDWQEFRAETIAHGIPRGLGMKSKEEILKIAYSKTYYSLGFKCSMIQDYKDIIEEAMTEYAHQAIEEAAESAKLKSIDEFMPGGTLQKEVDKSSILKLKEKY